MLLNIEHVTTYFYRRPVQFGPHRLLIRAIEGHDVQIRRSGLGITPVHRIRWLRDIFGNSVAIVDFAEQADKLEVRSTLCVEQFNTNPFEFTLDPHALRLPFKYQPSEQPDVAPYAQIAHPTDVRAVSDWIRPFLGPDGSAGTLEFFTVLNKSVPLFLQYNRREEPGVQTPGETLSRRSGSCRDFAQLFMEAARQLGVGARFVSGYLCRAEAATAGWVASDATHAWAEIYLPGAGWKGFDPTCGILAADLHVRTAVSRDPAQAIPVAGSFVGGSTDFLRMEVTVNAWASPAPTG